MSYILNSGELLSHIPKEGISEESLQKTVMRMRNISKIDAKRSIDRALSKKTVIRKGSIIKPSPSIKFLQ